MGTKKKILDKLHHHVTSCHLLSMQTESEVWMDRLVDRWRAGGVVSWRAVAVRGVTSWERIEQEAGVRSSNKSKGVAFARKCFRPNGQRLRLPNSFTVKVCGDGADVSLMWTDVILSHQTE